MWTHAQHRKDTMAYNVYPYLDKDLLGVLTPKVRDYTPKLLILIKATIKITAESILLK